MSFVNIPLEKVSRCNEKNCGGFFGLELDFFSYFLLLFSLFLTLSGVEGIFVF